MFEEDFGVIPEFLRGKAKDSSGGFMDESARRVPGLDLLAKDQLEFARILAGEGREDVGGEGEEHFGGELGADVYQYTERRARIDKWRKRGLPGRHSRGLHCVSL